MPTYQAPVDDWLFILNEFLKVQEHHELPGYAELTAEFCADVLHQAAKFHENVVFPVCGTADKEGAHLVDGKVRTPRGFPDVWRKYREAGWLTLSLPESIGGAGLPAILSGAIGEMRAATAHSFSMYVSFCTSAARMLSALGDKWMRSHVVPRLVSGEWTATMCLTESHCGTDLRQIRTRATPQNDGSWRIDGTKIFISGGDHDLGENVIHIVLAKVPGEDGTISSDLASVNVFLVSKLDLNPEDGTAAGENGVHVGSLEHKMGIEGNATCVMNFEGARAWRIADMNASGTAANMAAMFLLMNYARVSTALQGVAYAEIAGQNARAYARERLAGRSPTGARYPELPGDPLIVQPDIRRLLMGARSFAEGGRATALRVSMWQAQAESEKGGTERSAAADLMDLFTPIMKAYFTDKGFEATNDSLQVLGGHGYIKEYGLEQMVRNARIGQIYEGANGIQAIDLVQRKLPAKGWRAPAALLREIDASIDTYRDDSRLGPCVASLKAGRELLAGIFQTLKKNASEEPQANLVVAYDVLEACGIVAIGWTWTGMAAAAVDSKLLSPVGRRRKLALATYWMEREMPKLQVLSTRVVSGVQSTLTLADDEI